MRDDSAPRTGGSKSCDDGDACTTNDTCVDGACFGGAPLDCDDGNPCTDDSCIPASGCVNTNNSAPCDEGLYCTVDDTCQCGSCVGAERSCDDGDECTIDSCDEANDRRARETDVTCRLDHQKCYCVRPKGWRFHRQRVMLEDQFATQEMEVVSPKRFCNPADKNGEGIVDPTAHLSCYKLKRQGDCRKSTVICVPSTKRLASPSGAFLEITSDLLD